MPAISSAGIGSGLDVQSIVSQLMAIERQPLRRLQIREDQYQAQISAYGQLSSALSTFQTVMEDLSSLSALKVFQSVTSNPDVVNVTTTKNADIGSFGVEVVRLAERHKMSSAEFSSTQTFGGTAGDVFSIQVGSDPAASVIVDLGTAKTLQEVRDAINDDVNNPGVQATIVNGSNGNQKLVMTATNSGADNALTLSYGGTISSATLGFQTVNNIGGDLTLLDSEMNVDGYNITRSSNNISDVISGVTINLVSANPGTTHTIGVERDEEAVQASVQSFADAFNELRESIKSLRNGQLEADSSLLSIERQIFGVLNNPGATGTFSTLSEIGLSMQKDGTMTLSSSQLKTALQSDFDGVANLFAADGQGYANRLGTRVDAWLTSGGMLESRTDGLNARVDDLNDRQESIERNLGMVEARYRAKFTALDALIGQLQGTSNFLTAQLDKLPGYSRE